MLRSYGVQAQRSQGEAAISAVPPSLNRTLLRSCAHVARRSIMDVLLCMSRPGDTTESERIPRKLTPRSPGLRLLFSAEAIVPGAPWYPLSAGDHQLGRDLGKAQGLELSADRRASRVHAAVTSGGSATPLEIRDADSKNGLFVNGTRCPRAALRDGDLIRIGDSLLIVRYEAASVADAAIPTLLGISVAQRALRARVHTLAASQAAVLLLGESGTGKDLTACALHAAAARRGPMIAVNCGAVPDSLAESLFFGHVGGSFTGAGRDRAGFFTAADHGTLFLDEVGELSPRGQALLLRVLEDHMVTPLGATQPQSCDVRVVAATNRDLPRAVQRAEFRGDLYARLAGLTLQLPPLRDRREDILLLLAHELGSKSPPMTARLAEALLLYPFPFNIRELFQLAQELRSSQDALLDLPLISDRLSTPPHSQTAEASDAPRDADELPLPKAPLSREVLLRLMQEHRGIIARVAQAAGRSRRQVMRWLEQHQIDASHYKR